MRVHVYIITRNAKPLPATRNNFACDMEYHEKYESINASSNGTLLHGRSSRITQARNNFHLSASVVRVPDVILAGIVCDFMERMLSHCPWMYSSVVRVVPILFIRDINCTLVLTCTLRSDHHCS